MLPWASVGGAGAALGGGSMLPSGTGSVDGAGAVGSVGSIGLFCIAPVYHRRMNSTMIGNLTIVLPYAPAVIGIAGVIRKRYGARINGPLRVLVLLVTVAALLLFGLDAVPAEATMRESVIRFVRCAVLLALEAFGITYGLDRLGARMSGGASTNGGSAVIGA